MEGKRLFLTLLALFALQNNKIMAEFNRSEAFKGFPYIIRRKLC